MPDSIEVGVPGGDGNGDGMPDHQQANVTSLPNAADGRYVAVESPDGTRLVGVRALADSSYPGAPAEVLSFPIGLLSFSAEGVTPGGTVTVTLHLPPEIDVDSYWKYDEAAPESSAWYEFALDGETGAEFDGNRVLLHFVDGGRGDADGLANGSITDPGAPALRKLSAGDVDHPTGESPGLRIDLPYPHPVGGPATIQYWLPASAQAEIEVFDLLGRRVAILASGVVAAGRHEVRLAADGLVNGLYLCRLRAGGRSTSITFVVRR